MKNIIYGFIIGIANIIPGVSGGTFALILGIYPKLLKSIGTFDTRFANSIVSQIKSRNFTSLRGLLFTDQLLFLAQLAVGAVGAILVLSKLIKFLLETQYEVTYGFFLGLIVFSIAIPYRLLDRKKITDILWLTAGLGVTLYISIQVDPSAKMLEKSMFYQHLLNTNAGPAMAVYSLGDYLATFLVGMVAVSAMVLPGISGSFILLLFGKYYQVIAAASRIEKFYMEDIIFFGILVAGCLAGLLLFVKLFNYVFERFKNQTIWFLMGLMVGSVHALWPFKQFQLVDLYVKSNQAIMKIPQYKVYGNQLRIFENFQELWPVALCFAVGGVIMIFFNRYEKSHSP